MKKLSLILVLIMTLSLMVGALTTIAFAAGDGTQANPITVGGEGADYATVGEALAAIGTAEGTTYIKVTGNTTETKASNIVATDVVIYSEATGDARPTITLAADASTGGASYGYWVMVDGAEFTIEGIKIDTSAFNTALNKTLASGTFIPKNGGKISVVNCIANNGGTTARNGGFVHFADESSHYGHIVIDNSTITSDNRGIHWGKSANASSISVINGSSIKSTASHAIQASITTMSALTVKVVDSTLEAPNGVGIYNRAAEAVVELINATVTTGSGKQVLDARNDKATLDFTVVGGTFSSTELVKLKSKTAVINVFGADISGITSAIVNNEGGTEDIIVNTYNVTYGECKTFTKVSADKIVELDALTVDLILKGWHYDEATDTYTVATADALLAVVAEVNAGNLDANIILAADIDLAGKAYTPIAPGNSSATAGYTGTFDGQGYAIKNFTSSQTTNGNNGPGAGFIQLAGACTVKNVTFVNPVVEGVRGTAVVIAKTVGGEKTQTVTIENCNIINAKASGAGKQSYIAGLIGEFKGLFSASIKNCVVDVNITTTGDYAGTLIGGESGADSSSVFAVENVIATGTVTAGKGAGMFGYICDLNVEATNVVSFVKATTTVAGYEKNASSVVGYPKRTSVTLKNVLCTDAPIGFSDSIGNKVVNIIKLENVHVLGTDAASIFNNVSIDATNGAQLIVDNADAVTDVDSFKAATVSALSDGFAHAMIKTEIFANNAALRDAALALIPHEHVFDQEVAEKEYLASDATCTEKAKYFKSCICTEKGEETFEVGDLLPHVAGKNYEKNDTQHWAPCTACGTPVYFDHVFDQEIAGDEYFVSDATCTTGAVFYKSCVCGLKGEETFMSIGSLGHLFGEWTTVTEPTVDAEGVKERECSVCGEKETKSIEKLPAPEAPAEEPTFVDKAVDFAVTAKNWVVRKAIAVKNKAAGALGCGGSIGGTSIIIMLAAAGAVIARKKED